MSLADISVDAAEGALEEVNDPGLGTGTTSASDKQRQDTLLRSSSSTLTHQDSTTSTTATTSATPLTKSGSRYIRRTLSRTKPPFQR